jgi:hypothetical protein
MARDTRQIFQELAKALMELHRDLLMLQAKALESESGRKISPYELLHASLHDPQFAWLRLMSDIIVNIDTLVDESESLSGKEASEIAEEVLNLIEKSPDSRQMQFWKRYSYYLSLNPDIIMKHSRVKEIITRLKPSM